MTAENVTRGLRSGYWAEIKIGPTLTDGSDLVYVDFVLMEKTEARTKQKAVIWVKLALS
jgi:hypothetical protein